MFIILYLLYQNNYINQKLYFDFGLYKLGFKFSINKLLKYFIANFIEILFILG